MARIGKIARLPAEIREELNRKLRAGQLGPQVLPWLNEQTEVRGVLNEFFGGQAVNAQNLSDWRQGGYKEWEEKQDRTWRVRELAGVAAKLAEANGGTISEGAAAILSGKILEVLERLESTGLDDKEGIAALSEALSSMTLAVSRLRRGDAEREKIRQRDEVIGLDKAQFEQRLIEYQDKVAAQKREIEGALAKARDGGITPETLRTIEEAARLL